MTGIQLKLWKLAQANRKLRKENRELHSSLIKTLVKYENDIDNLREALRRWESIDRKAMQVATRPSRGAR